MPCTTPCTMPCTSTCAPSTPRCGGGNSQPSGATAMGLWSGYVMQLSQPEDLSFGTTNTNTIVDELEVFESGP